MLKMYFEKNQPDAMRLPSDKKKTDPKTLTAVGGLISTRH